LLRNLFPARSAEFLLYEKSAYQTSFARHLFTFSGLEHPSASIFDVLFRFFLLRTQALNA
jgi:hypothetical protein